MLASALDLIKKAQKGHYAIGAFNTYNLEVTLGIIRAALLERSPVVIQVSENTIFYAGLRPIISIVKTIAADEAGDVPVALHLDHGKSFHTVVECINNGFSSIMIDASSYPLEENIRMTKEVVEYAHKKGACVQGELGRVKKAEDYDLGNNVTLEEIGELMTKPDEVEKFVSETKVDSLAISIGNAHGMDVPGLELDLERLRKIKKIVSIPLVLHGASGIAPDQIRNVIKEGITECNIDTETQFAFTNMLKEILEENPHLLDPRKILAPCIDAVRAIVESKIELFGSGGKI